MRSRGLVLPGVVVVGEGVHPGEGVVVGMVLVVVVVEMGFPVAGVVKLGVLGVLAPRLVGVIKVAAYLSVGC